MANHNHKIVIAASLLILGAILYFSDGNPKVLRAGTGDNVSGWAWSSNIGWISFNCTNSASCSESNYGVRIDNATGLFSGYAWSPNVGWISFNQSELSGCPSAPCEARVSGGLSGAFPKEASGWAKVLSTNNWMRLRGTGYSVQLESSGDFSGWSWESTDIGWLSWSGSNYGARANLITLNVLPSGTGQGNVIGVPAGIDCGLDCSESYTSGVMVTLTASPSPGSAFQSWSGCDTATGTTCILNMTASKIVTANFISFGPAGIKEIKP